VAILERRGYAVAPARLGELCLGGRVEEDALVAALPAAGLRLEAGLVTAGRLGEGAAAICARQAGHRLDA